MYISSGQERLYDVSITIFVLTPITNFCNKSVISFGMLSFSHKMCFAEIVHKMVNTVKPKGACTIKAYTPLRYLNLI